MNILNETGERYREKRGEGRNGGGEIWRKGEERSRGKSINQFSLQYSFAYKILLIYYHKHTEKTH